MPSFEVEFEIYCSCGNGLCGQSTTKGMKVIVEPCEECKAKEYDSGYNKGYDEGYDEGYADCDTRREGIAT